MPLKPLSEDAREAAIRYIDMALAHKPLIGLPRMYLENAKTLLNGGKV